MNNRNDLLRRNDVATRLMALGLKAGSGQTRAYARCVNEVETMPEADVWVNAKHALPGSAIDGFVLAIVNGKYKNIAFENAYMLAEYVPGEGWIIGDFEEWENPQVTYWAKLPELPKEG